MKNQGGYEAVDGVKRRESIEQIMVLERTAHTLINTESSVSRGRKVAPVYAAIVSEKVSRRRIIVLGPNAHSSINMQITPLQVSKRYEM